jgi:hypothetical protein
VRLSLADGSIAQFRGLKGSNFSTENAMTLSDDGTVLYVGYTDAMCVVAYDVATLHLKWKACLGNHASCLSYHDGLVFVTVRDTPFTILSAEDGSVVRRLARVPNRAYSHSILPGLELSILYSCHEWLSYQLIMLILLVLAYRAMLLPLMLLSSFEEPASRLKFSD